MGNKTNCLRWKYAFWPKSERKIVFLKIGRGKKIFVEIGLSHPKNDYVPPPPKKEKGLASTTGLMGLVSVPQW